MARMSARRLGVRGILRGRVGWRMITFRGWCLVVGCCDGEPAIYIRLVEVSLGVEFISRMVHSGMVAMVSYILFFTSNS